MSLRAYVVVLCLVALPCVLFLDYVLPRHDVVRIVNTEVKRVDPRGGSVGDQREPGADVYYIYAEDIETKKPHVYRNEDTGWGFPFYFKFNSADVQAVASSIASEKGIALITKYGWRLTVFSMFPNVTSVRRWDPADTVVPWFNIVFFSLIGAAALYVAIRIRRRRSA
ncbi:DUF1523 family protein [Hansschlegelia sp.]|uniref:DUF1523 family protein n=1 Tax=Hansschlegelia sp. TaxID=2041892 RepID=UPI002BC2F4A1|nr:DUF1523 family protein [Hansschlegelia sp.]HVI30393.1 DUF1523 family protein [Hansschlegelia sp.]